MLLNGRVYITVSSSNRLNLETVLTSLDARRFAVVHPSSISALRRLRG